jgi:hypothetical protein
MTTKTARRKPIIIGSNVTHITYGHAVIVARDGRKAHIEVIDRRTGDTMTLAVKTASLRIAA